MTPSEVARQVCKIKTIASVAELDAYEAAAKARGIEAGELREISLKRFSLTQKKRRK